MTLVCNLEYKTLCNLAPTAPFNLPLTAGVLQLYNQEGKGEARGV